MGELILNVYVYRPDGSRLWAGDIPLPLPKWLKQSHLYILSPYKGGPDKHKPAFVRRWKIAEIRNGVFVKDAAEWERNYGRPR